MMTAHYREAGTGPAVVCLHCSASTSGQWRPLMERISERFHVIAADLYGSGKSAVWPDERMMWIDDQIAQQRLPLGVRLVELRQVLQIEEPTFKCSLRSRRYPDEGVHFAN